MTERPRDRRDLRVGGGAEHQRDQDDTVRPTITGLSLVIPEVAGAHHH